MLLSAIIRHVFMQLRFVLVIMSVFWVVAAAD